MAPRAATGAARETGARAHAFRAHPPALPSPCRAAQTLSREASPLGCLRESMAIRAHLGYYLPAACAFATFHLRAENVRVPNAAALARVRDEEATFTGLMRLAGMHVVSSNQTSLSFARLPFFHARGKLVQPGAPAQKSPPRIAAPNGAALVDEGWLTKGAFVDLKKLFRDLPDNVITFEKDMVLGPRMFNPFDFATHGKSCELMRPTQLSRYASYLCRFIDELKAGRLPWLGTPAGAEFGRHLLPELGRLHSLCLWQRVRTSSRSSSSSSHAGSIRRHARARRQRLSFDQ